MCLGIFVSAKNILFTFLNSLFLITYCYYCKVVGSTKLLRYTISSLICKVHTLGFKV